MSYVFCHNNFPIVHLKFLKNPNEEELNILFEEWIKYYEKKRYMIFVIDAYELNDINIKTLKKIVQFGNDIKTHHPFVSLTIFYFKSKLLKQSFQTALKMSKPIRPIILTRDKSIIDEITSGQLEFVNVNDYNVNYPSNMNMNDLHNLISNVIS
tara:strand:+ start:1076 stop:1537 length:462 start_codon:yes stop_codon:yes gene_type:complete